MLADGLNLLHEHNVIHGDITPSNVLYSATKLYWVDFGLAFVSFTDEDKAVDLFGLERTCGAEFFSWVLEGYRSVGVLERLEGVRRRGRKRDMSG